MNLKPGREKSLMRRHPWVFSGAVHQVVGEPADGDVIPVFSAENRFIAQIAYSHNSQIVGRVWSYQQDQIVDQDFIRSLLEKSIALREGLGIGQVSDSLRLVHAESDGIPGLVVDQYAKVIVAQILSNGVEVWREAIAEILLDLTGVEAIYERSDAEVRILEGLEHKVGLLAGSEFVDPLEISEYGIKYLVPITSGHKTGFYLDQRANRQLLQKYAAGKDVLDCFSYSGGFSLNAAAGGANSVTAVDNSAPALELLQQNSVLNSYDEKILEIIQADVFKQLRKFRDQGRSFDLIILDPPKFAPTRSHANQAARGYKDINLLAFKLLRPGGTLFTFSCSGGIDEALFQKIVAGAALDASVDARILHRMSQSADHPVGLNFPEGQYLKGLVCRIG
ncbi:MAG: class I SAM-dependent rRNA methyltransferase [Chloroflexota bacterium]